ncbi:MAG: LCP family protein [Anaerolineales bacterium]|nr:LCP family protein [Anaerolineales bacterium]
MRLPSWALGVWVIIAVLIGAGGSYFGYTQTRERTREVNEITPLSAGVDWLETFDLLTGRKEPELPDKVLENEPPVLIPTQQPTLTPTTEPSTPTDSATPVPVETEAVTPEPTAVVENTDSGWTDPRRVNILLLGIDQRQGETGPFRTDTMMVLSLKPANNSGVMLSIPRDIYLTYPRGLGEGKINNANVVGEVNQYPGGGPAFAKLAVETLLGIRIHYYVLVNFDSFITVVNAVGDVEVCPPTEIDDPDYPDGSYGYKAVYFPAGCQDLNAEHLLEYARTRATEGGDIDRANRQQEVILGIREKVLSVGGATALLDQAPTIWDSIQANIRTDSTFQDIINLALLAQNIPSENIRNETIGYDRVLIRKGPNDEDILLPIQGSISELVAELFN